ncbi:MAG: acetate--CoA ligase family protein [Candidatus Micrarchaeota archaeon]|nr:acetate--CoA ligase family protein [Candidatus Micrarchaeota archaeon]
MPLLDYMQARKLLDKYKIKSIGSAYVNSAESAADFAKGKRIVLKLISEKAVHKSRAGLVKLDIDGEKEIAAAYDDLVRRGRMLRPYKILAQKMADPGVEIIIGGNTDAQFGKVLLVGLGGVYVEAFKDVQLRLCPITKADAVDMLSELQSRKIVTYDGKAEDEIVSLLMKVSKLLTENKKVSELDLNPVIVRQDSYEAVDIRILT